MITQLRRNDSNGIIHNIFNLSMKSSTTIAKQSIITTIWNDLYAIFQQIQQEIILQFLINKNHSFNDFTGHQVHQIALKDISDRSTNIKKHLESFCIILFDTKFTYKLFLQLNYSFFLIAYGPSIHQNISKIFVIIQTIEKWFLQIVKYITLYVLQFFFIFDLILFFFLCQNNEKYFITISSSSSTTTTRGTDKK